MGYAGMNNSEALSNDAFFKDDKSGKIVNGSPCINLTKYPNCIKYCRWHEDIFSNKMAKDEFLDLMR